MSSNQMSKAELQFYEAFIRLKNNKPNILPKGTKVSQNNVAKEAGVDPSALRKSRYPNLISEIQEWMDQNPQNANVSKKKNEKSRSIDKISTLNNRIDVLTQERDDAVSKLLEAQLTIIELSLQLEKIVDN
ncbi:hypothetical protein [Acinetobacter sp. YH12103]|uniref:hypothetical protein n=1 Tax=Acinetobacter sp. YH12103 TaxID=2601092 RepID=UPI0015D1AFFC|nr:hypothetical protein [Acinetobacter sp. YH12103]